MSEKLIEVWGVVQVETGGLAGMFETQAEALARMRELSPAYIVYFGNKRWRTDARFWEMKSGGTRRPVHGVTHH